MDKIAREGVSPTTHVIPNWLLEYVTVESESVHDPFELPHITDLITGSFNTKLSSLYNSTKFLDFCSFLIGINNPVLSNTTVMAALQGNICKVTINYKSIIL